jgi:predicted nucleic acid-binding protein
MDYYVDSCIWIDLFEDRTDGLRPLGEFAFCFFKKCLSSKSKIYFSELVFEELSNYISKKEIENIIKDYSEIVIFVNYSDEQKSFAKKLTKRVNSIHFSDALHAVIAKKYNCVLITRDNHFNELSFFVKVLAPEEV